MQAQIDSVLQQTEEIAQQVRNNNWPVVEQMTIERQNSLETLFSQPIQEQYVQKIARMAQEIMAKDKAFVNHIEQQKHQALNDYQNMNNHKRANASYQSVANLHQA
ncbi:MAG: flagellar protein FliT [Gammaproteobacteria bacterium]|nr:flagellar protein FliT [Gammaproteobacteria bacterium]NNJ71731.1 flagellar protein FliT [Enterobacterales bacterium]